MISYQHIYKLLHFTVLMIFICSCANQQKSKGHSGAKRRKITKEDISEIIMENIGQFKYCYRKSLKRHKRQISGNVTLVFVLDSRGRPHRAGVSETDLPVSLRACLIEEVWKIKFPAPGPGRTLKINQPLIF